SGAAMSAAAASRSGPASKLVAIVRGRLLVVRRVESGRRLRHGALGVELRQQGRRLLAHQAHGPLPVLQLELSDELVPLIGHEFALQAVPQDDRPNEYHQVSLDSLCRARAEERTDAGDASETRYALLALAQLIVDQAAEHDDLAVLGEDRR